MGSALRYLLIVAALFFPSAPVFAVGEMPSTKAIDHFKAPEKLEDDDLDDEDVRQGFDAMGHDIKKFGEDVAQRIDRIVKKKTFEFGGDPWTMQGIPIVFPSGPNGFNLGLRVQLQNIRRQDPHKMEVIAQILSSDKGRQKHMLQLDFPWAFGNKMRITGRFAYDRDVSLGYYGIGNNVPFDPVRAFALDPYYQDLLTSPSLFLQVAWYFGKYFRAGPLIQFKWNEVSFGTGTLLDAERPVGINGGNTHSLGVALTYDTLDFEPYPSRGDFHEIFFNLSRAGVTGSDYNFTRTTYTFRKYISLHRRLIFAHRTMIEYLDGDVPFFELGNVGGSYGSIGLGGDRFVRGYFPNQFIDKMRLFMGFELRWDPIVTNFMRQDLTVGFVPFIDLGHVWPRLLPDEINYWKVSAGWGTRIIWNSRLVVRLETAFTPMGIRLAVNIGNSF